MAGDNVCTDTPTPFCGGPNNCVCFATVEGGTFCGGGNRSCADCTTDAQCEVLTGVPGSACVQFDGGPSCFACADNDFHACVEPC